MGQCQQNSHQQRQQDHGDGASVGGSTAPRRSTCQWLPDQRSTVLAWPEGSGQGSGARRATWGKRSAASSAVRLGSSPERLALVVASGPSQLNQWLHVERDVRADFAQAFGEAPGALLSIALMTDTDNTRSSARAYYGPVAWRKP